MSTLQKGNTSVSISAVDLFCGVGGLTHGLQQAGITVHAGLDVDATCRYAFETNNQAQFNVPVSITRLGIHIGNAVPVRLAAVIGQSIQKHVEENRHG